MITGVRGGVLVGLALLVAGCTDTPESPAPAPSTTTTAAAPTTTTSALPREESIVAMGYAAVCKGDGFADAAEYTGKGPHSIAVSAESKVKAPKADHDDSGLDQRVDNDVVELPDEWTVEANTDLPLVACVQVVGITKVRDCGYTSVGSFSTGARDVTAELYERTLRVEVRSTRTGKVLRSAGTVKTSGAACAGSIPQPEDGSAVGPTQYGALSAAQRDKLLAPLVTKDL